ncbi:hypothetical protein GCM10011375_34330 [Hymenobacter qilianensis]|uniref:Uncharacterized protein n=1 Tax=Hymenobacter qilianensis TaxID=1385715 RepID=A0ACB5PVM2_9BACT|nr:hypothetical protein GCM10011375_34330 [Hymenobacter qilianensis]
MSALPGCLAKKSPPELVLGGFFVDDWEGVAAGNDKMRFPCMIRPLNPYLPNGYGLCFGQAPERAIN